MAIWLALVLWRSWTHPRCTTGWTSTEVGSITWLLRGGGGWGVKSSQKYLLRHSVECQIWNVYMRAEKHPRKREWGVEPHTDLPVQRCRYGILFCSVPDPNPDPPDPRVFGPPGSGSISQRYGFRSGSCSGSGSGSFYHSANIVRKTLISTVLWHFFDFLSLKIMYK